MKHILQAWLLSLKHYVQMALFRSSPSNLPYSLGALALTLLAYMGVGELLLGERRDFIWILAQVLIELSILLAITFIILKLIQKPQRLLQTLSALMGVSLVVSLVSLPLTAWLPPIDDPENIDPLVLQVNLMLLLWNLAVISLIFKRAFEIRTLLAGFIALNYFLLYEFILINFF